MRRLPLIFLIILLIFTQGVQPFMFASDKEMDSKQKLNIKVDPEATNQYTVVTLLTEDPIVDEVHIKLPEKSTYDQEQTAQLKQKSTTFQYDENNQLLKIEWSGDSSESKREAKFLLSDLEEAENNIQAIGLIEKKKVAEAEETFQVNMVEENKTTDSKENQSDEPEKETDKRLEEDGNKAETNKEEKPEKTNQSNINEEDKNETAEEKQSKDELTKTEKERTTENNVIKEIETPNKKQTDKKDKKKGSTDENTKVVTPFVGDLNTDIDLSPYKTTVESGKAAMYKLVLKTTGSQKLYEDSTLTVKLPITDYTQFTQDVYEFSDQLRAGETYEKIIKVKTENLNSPNGAELNAIATLQVTDKEQTQEFIDDATVKINSSGAINISKEYIRAEKNQETILAPTLNSYIRWEITVDIPKKDIGQMYLKEGSKIVITDTLPQGIEFTKMNRQSAPQPTQNGNKLTWEFDAPSLLGQGESDENFFTQTLTFWTKVDNDKKLVNTKINNTATATATFIDGKPIDPPEMQKSAFSNPYHQQEIFKVLFSILFTMVPKMEKVAKEPLREKTQIPLFMMMHIYIFTMV
ncbi:adhesive domain-containing protein [Cerasibacillus quisquiliarum]|uniref:adhesive domain-containing protein n=1 Tax=Cerasibacillus quisquiliarum TaxID=227865 RepID=UPI0027D9868F|nr:adhesive domain-containing protein [Cerasibacillus quisquiliarum]